MMKDKKSWLAVDWGTSFLRVWKIGGDGATIGERRAIAGAANLRPDMFEPALLAAAEGLIGGEDRVCALVCGMAGARNRWREAPYLRAPRRPVEVADLAVRAPTANGRLSARIAPGLSQESPPDVMRGEETQLAGLLALQPDYAGVVCLPGTHAKWATIAGGKVVSFMTLMSGEMYHLSATESILRRAVESPDWDKEAFLAAAEESWRRPEKIAALLFSIRAESLLRNLPKGAARAKLSGYWLGLDLAASREYWEGAKSVTIIGESELSERYRLALERRCVAARALPAKELTLTGLKALHARLAAAGEWME